MASSILTHFTSLENLHEVSRQNEASIAAIPALHMIGLSRLFKSVMSCQQEAIENPEKEADCTILAEQYVKASSEVYGETTSSVWDAAMARRACAHYYNNFRDCLLDNDHLYGRCGSTLITLTECVNLRKEK